MFGPQHLVWVDKLQAIADRKIQRLMGLMPPGSGKSLYTSVCFPTFYLGGNPNSKIIVTSYNSDLPERFGSYARTIVRSERYKRIFGCTLSGDTKAKDQWELTNGSGWFAAGILAGLTGQRADGIIWDDLMKGRDEADSPTMRAKTWDAYISDLLSRVRSDQSWEIGVNTRWHQDDPAGRILPEYYNGESGLIHCRDGNYWEIVCIPAIAERDDDPLGRKPGEPMWPQVFNLDYYEKKKRVSARDWISLYQQRPAPETGSYFEESWFRLYDSSQAPPRDSMHIYGASDYATTDKGGDYTVHVVVGVDKYHDIYILDLWRQRVASDKWVESFCDLCTAYKPISGWAEESGQIKAGVGPFLEKRMRERHVYVARKDFPSKGDKTIRARAFQGRMAMGKIYFPHDKSWFPELKRELLLFPSGTHDDQVDALGLIGQILDVMVSGEPPEKSATTIKLLSMDPEQCTLTLGDLFEENEKRTDMTRNLRIY